VLTSLEIKNFRTFHHLRIERLGRVNLVVGKNNVGKTTLLEAIRVYASAWPSRAIMEILGTRDEVVGQPGERAILALNAVFHGREAHKGTQAVIRPVLSDVEELQCRILAGVAGPDTEGYRVDIGAQGPFAPRVQLLLDICSGGRKWRLWANGSVGAGDDPWQSAKPPELDPTPPLLRGLDTAQIAEDTAQRWDAIALTESEDRVLEALAMVVPIRGVSYVQHPQRGRGRMPKVRLDAFSDPVPLVTLGDGVVRIFQLATALEYAGLIGRNLSDLRASRTVFPTVLIDEVDTGIHHTRQTDLWRFIFQAARLLDIQVFATTHSWDCLKGFAQAVKEDHEADAMAVRLEKVEGYEQTGAVTMDRSDLPIVVRDSIEVR